MTPDASGAGLLDEAPHRVQSSSVESSFLSRHLERENVAIANPLGNQAHGSSTGFSFRSSLGAMAWSSSIRPLVPGRSTPSDTAETRSLTSGWLIRTVPARCSSPTASHCCKTSCFRRPLDPRRTSSNSPLPSPSRRLLLLKHHVCKRNVQTSASITIALEAMVHTCVAILCTSCC